MKLVHNYKKSNTSISKRAAIRVPTRNSALKAGYFREGPFSKELFTKVRLPCGRATEVVLDLGRVVEGELLPLLDLKGTKVERC